MKLHFNLFRTKLDLNADITKNEKEIIVEKVLEFFQFFYLNISITGLNSVFSSIGNIGRLHIV